MRRSHIKPSVVFVVLLILANCGIKDRIGQGLYFELEKIDSFQVEYNGPFHGIDFHKTEGVIYNFRDGSFQKFTIEGKTLAKNTIPQEGANSISYIGGIKMLPDGRTFLQSLKGEIGILDEELNLIEKLQMPFAPSLSDLRSNVKSMEIVEDYVYIYFPGRDGANPYEKGFFKNNHLLEKVELKTGKSTPFLRLPEGSKYQEELYFEHPFIFLSIFEDKIYFAFDNEPIIYVFRISDGEFLNEIPLNANNFVELEGQVIPLDLTTIKIPGMIDGLYAFENGVAVNYLEGVTEEALKNETNPQGNPQNHIFKVYLEDKGWSNEIIVPSEISYLLNFESPEEEFFALKNDPIPSTQRNMITFYRLRLTKK